MPKKTTAAPQGPLDRFLAGSEAHLQDFLGSHPAQKDGQEGYLFRVWAPHAKAVHLMGEFNGWATDQCPLSPIGGGVWEGFVPGLERYATYKYAIHTQAGEVLAKADPFAFHAETRPGNGSKVYDLTGYEWGDGKWLEWRKDNPVYSSPLNIYEMHLGSWRRTGEDEFLSYRDMAQYLVPYIKEMGFTHVEFMPVMEHPFDGSWGYQTTGYFAPTSRYGSPQDFMFLVDSLHQAGIGVILDWVPGHFCRDEHGLVQFDGSNLYETEEHIEWGTYKFNYRLNEVRSFLISSAMFWLDIYHADGIRCDGISSMLYLNYGVGAPNLKRFNERGGEEDLTAVAFLQQLNQTLASFFPDVFMIAEESTAWPLVTYPPAEGGLGFHYKWDMGWMNDTLKYMSLDFPGRFYNHRLLTFSMMYAFNEKIVFPHYQD